MSTLVLSIPVLSLAIIAARAGSTRVSPGDASMWHTVWVSLAVVSLLVPVLALAAPFVVVLPIRASAGASVVYATLSSPALSRVEWWLAAVYIAGAACCFARVLLALVIVTNLRRSARLLTPSEAGRISAVAPYMAQRCRVHPGDGPATIGWWRPQVVLPEEWSRWSADRLAAVLRHEAAHVLRRDPLWHAIGALQQVVYWPSPLSSLLAREIRKSAEIAADQIAAGEDRSAYALQVIALAEEWLDRRVSAHVLAPSAASDLPARVEALLSDTAPNALASRKRKVAIVTVVLFALLAPATVRLVRPSPQTAHGHNAKHAASHSSAGK